MPNDAAPPTDWAAVSARAQAYLCLHHAGLNDASNEFPRLSANFRPVPQLASYGSCVFVGGMW